MEIILIMMRSLCSPHWENTWQMSRAMLMWWWLRGTWWWGIWFKITTYLMMMLEMMLVKVEQLWWWWQEYAQSAMSGPLFNHSLLSQIASLLDGDDDDDSLEHSPLAVSEHPPIVSYTLRYVSLFIVRYVTSSYRVLPRGSVGPQCRNTSQESC